MGHYVPQGERGVTLILDSSTVGPENGSPLRVDFEVNNFVYIAYLYVFLVIIIKSFTKRKPTN